MNETSLQERRPERQKTDGLCISVYVGRATLIFTLNPLIKDIMRVETISKFHLSNQIMTSKNWHSNTINETTLEERRPKAF